MFEDYYSNLTLWYQIRKGVGMTNNTRLNEKISAM